MTPRQIRGLDFANLSLVDALDIAVLIEEEARERYAEFAYQMELHRTPEAARFFWFMEGNEEKHRATLESQRAARFGDAPRRVTRAMIFDIEAPDYDAARAFMTLREALGAALKAEEKAADFFAAALPVVTDPDVKALFAELHEEELEHQRLVKVHLDKAPPDPAIHPSEFADDPVAID